MAKTTTPQEQRAVGPQSIGFDYQFYYFMYLSLKLKHGQKIGYEVKDDIHIDKEDGSTILLQAKHSTVEKADGSIQNLTTMDLDMWKSLNNWALFINSAESKSDFLGSHSFILVTNKSENNNEFISSLAQFNEDLDVNTIIEKIKSLEKSTTSKTLQGYINNILKIGKRSLIVFFLKLSIETGVDEIIQKIKNRLFELYRADHIVDTIYDSLYSSLQETKYLEIKAGKKFEITFEDFSKKFAKCFKVASGVQKLPIRDFKIFLPENPEDQVFIKQLIDIGAIKSGSKYIILYTTQMLKFTRHFTFWSDQENFILLPEADEFKKDSIMRWDNEFQAQYSKIGRKIDSGVATCDLEDEIKDAGCELIYSIRRLDLSIADYLPLGVEFTNGHFYSLSNELEIGWHFDWENKYKK